MKKLLYLTIGAALLASFAEARNRPTDDPMTPEQLKMTAEAAPKKLAVTPKKARNILVYYNTDGYRHNEGIVASNALMAELEKISGGKYKMTFSMDPASLTAENLKKFDCVVLNNCTGNFFRTCNFKREDWSAEQKKADEARAKELYADFMDWVKNGGGLMGIHAATDAMRGSEYVDMIGGIFAGHPWGAGNSPVTMLVEDGQNPVIKGIFENDEFVVQDEIYTFEDKPGFDRDKQRVLVSLDFDRSPKDGGRDPMLDTKRTIKDFGTVWIKNYQKGRIFYGGFGHRRDVFWRNPKICELYMRGLQFACGDLSADATPLGNEMIAKAQAKASVSGIKSLRETDFNQNTNMLEKVFFRAYKAATESKEIASEIEKLCVGELMQKQGTLRYQKLMSELLQVTGANSTAKQVGEIILRDMNEPKARYYVESLFISLVRSSDPNAKAVLKGLMQKGNDFVKRDAIAALGYIKDNSSVSTIASLISKDDKRTALCATNALARMETPQAYAKLCDAYKSVKDPVLKQEVALLMLSSKLATVEVASKLMSEKDCPKGVRTLAAIVLVKNGKDFSGEVYLDDIAKFLGMNKDVKIPASMELAKLSEADKAEMIYALANRGEGYEQIIATVPQTADTALAVTFAVSKFGKAEDLAKVAAFADMYDNSQAREAAFIIASINSKDKLKTLGDLSAALQGKPRDLIGEAMTNLDASASVDYLFNIISGGKTQEEKLTAIKTLENAVVKNTEVFVRASKLLLSAPADLKRPLMALMVACSRRDCDAKMVEAAQALFNAADSNQKASFLRFATANGADAGVQMCINAYKAGLKNQALAELSKWQNASALAPLMNLAEATKNPAEKKAIQKTMVDVISKSGALDDPAADYIVKQALDKKLSKLVEKMRRLDLKNFQLQEVGGGIVAAAFKASDLKNAFDGNINSRWSSNGNREPGQWIQFELPKVRLLKGIILRLGSSKNDGVLEPRVFVGENMEDFDEVEIAFSKDPEDNSDVITFKKPVKAKLVRIENTKAQGGWWSIHEVEFVDDPSVFKNLTPVGKGISAGANRGENQLKDAFDGNIQTRWSTNGSREPGQWFMFAFDKPRKVSAINLKLGDSMGDRILAPKVYAGDKIETMKPVKFKYKKGKDADEFTFETPLNVKFVRFENSQQSGGYWSIHEVEVK